MLSRQKVNKCSERIAGFIDWRIDDSQAEKKFNTLILAWLNLKKQIIDKLIRCSDDHEMVVVEVER